MKKILTVISFFIISFSFMWVAMDMSGMKSTYDGVGKVIVKNTIEKTGAINAVTATVFDFRGYDTLGEAIVLFTAICGVAAVLRPEKKAKEEK